MSPSKSIRRYKKHGLPRTDGALTCRITLATGRTINSLNKVASIQSTQYRYDPLGRLLQASHSDGKTETYRYDAPGQLGYLSDIEDEAATTSYERDVQGRVTAKTQTVKDNPARPSSYRVQYTYSAGQLSSTTYPSGLKTYYRRNPTGQITGIDVQAPGLLSSVLGSPQPFLTDLTHTPLGQPKSWRWSHCNSAANCDSTQRNFDADGRLTNSEIASYQYDAAGRITSLSQQLWSRAGGNNGEDKNDDNKNSSNSSNSSNKTTATTFSWRVAYDSRNRIANFTRTSPSSADSRYTWDANSNRLTALETTTADADLLSLNLAPLQTHQSSQTTQIESTSNRLLGFSQTLTLNQGTSSQGTGNPAKTQSSKAQITYTLDAAGNLVSDGLRQFHINAAGRIASVTQGTGEDQRKTTYLHNALGQRIFKSEPTGQDNSPPREEELGTDFVTWLKNNFQWLFSAGNSKTAQLGQAFVYDEQGSLLAEYGNGGSQGPGSAQIIWLPTQAGEQIPVGLYKNNRLYAIHPDHLGTPRLITDDTNQPVWQWPYSAWGTSPPSGVLKATGGSSTTAQRLERTEPGITVNLRFPGQYVDSETGVFYNYFRSYQPNQGRYSQPDPIGLAGGLNRFAYVDGDPLSFIDPFGLLFSSTLGGVMRNTTLDQAAQLGAAGNAAAAAGMAGAVGGAAAVGAGAAYMMCVPAPARTAIGLLKGLRDDAMPPPMPPRPPLLTPPAISRPGGFNPPAPPPGLSPRP